MNNKRLEWIDICKGIAIISIVLMHIEYVGWQSKLGGWFSNFTSLYKVSLFFCISGLTLKDERLHNTFNFIKGKIKSLYIKIIIIGLAAIVLHNVLIQIGFYEIGADYKGKIMYQYGITDFLKQSALTFLMANREVIIGPMWFANVLFLALIILAVLDRISYLFKDKHREARFIMCLILILMSSMLTNVLNFTIARFNNTLTACFLIDFCQLLVTKYKIKFNDKLFFIIFSLIFINLPFYGGLALASNIFVNPAFLVITALSEMYVFYFLGQKLEGSVIGKILAIIGKQSFWIMALQFIAFKLLSLILNNAPSTLTPNVSNLPLLILYLIIGVFLPTIFGLFIDKIGILIKQRNLLPVDKE